MRVVIDWVCRAKAQQFRKEYENIVFREGEKVDDFSMRLTRLVNQLRILGDSKSSQKVVEKVLRAIPPRFT